MLLLTGFGASNVRGVIAQTSTPLVFVVPIEGMIDLGLTPILARTMGEAKEAGASAVLLEINTFGGRWTRRSRCGTRCSTHRSGLSRSSTSELFPPVR